MVEFDHLRNDDPFLLRTERHLTLTPLLAYNDMYSAIGISRLSSKCGTYLTAVWARGSGQRRQSAVQPAPPGTLTHSVGMACVVDLWLTEVEAPELSVCDDALSCLVRPRLDLCEDIWTAVLAVHRYPHVAGPQCSLKAVVCKGPKKRDVGMLCTELVSPHRREYSDVIRPINKYPRPLENQEPVPNV